MLVDHHESFVSPPPPRLLYTSFLYFCQHFFFFSLILQHYFSELIIILFSLLLDQTFSVVGITNESFVAINSSGLSIACPKRARSYSTDESLSKFVKPSDPGQECIFAVNNIVSGELNQNVLINGFFPPCSASEEHPHSNRTSSEIKKIIKNNNFYWNDLFPYSPQDMVSVEQPEILAALRNNEFPNELIDEYFERMNRFIERERVGGNLNPLIVFVGQHANEVYI